MTDKELLLDFDGIVSEKLGGRKLPSWIMNPLRRFVREDYINGCLARGKVGVDFCLDVTDYMGVNLVVEGLENVPADGTLYTFVCNHPLGGVDGVALAGQIGSHFGQVTMLVNDFLMALPALRPLCIPINKTGGQSRNLPRLVNEAFDSDRQMMLFPAGICSRLIDGKVQDLPWTKTFITQSVRTQRDVVPVHFFGENSPRFYRIARMCKRLHLKVNLAMAFLPDELYRNRNKTFRIKFGTPIPYTTFDKSKTPAQWAQWVRDKVYEIQ